MARGARKRPRVGLRPSRGRWGASRGRQRPLERRGRDPRPLEAGGVSPTAFRTAGRASETQSVRAAPSRKYSRLQRPSTVTVTPRAPPSRVVPSATSAPSATHSTSPAHPSQSRMAGTSAVPPPPDPSNQSSLTSPPSRRLCCASGGPEATRRPPARTASTVQHIWAVKPPGLGPTTSLRLSQQQGTEEVTT